MKKTVDKMVVAPSWIGMEIKKMFINVILVLCCGVVGGFIGHKIEMPSWAAGFLSVILFAFLRNGLNIGMN